MPMKFNYRGIEPQLGWNPCGGRVYKEREKECILFLLRPKGGCGLFFLSVALEYIPSDIPYIIL